MHSSAGLTIRKELLHLPAHMLLKLHVQFSRAHRLPQLVFGSAHVDPRVGGHQINQNQRTESVLELLHGRSAWVRQQLAIMKPLHLRLRVP